MYRTCYQIASVSTRPQQTMAALNENTAASFLCRYDTDFDAFPLWSNGEQICFALLTCVLAACSGYCSFSRLLCRRDTFFMYRTCFQITSVFTRLQQTMAALNENTAAFFLCRYDTDFGVFHLMPNREQDCVTPLTCVLAACSWYCSFTGSCVVATRSPEQALPS